MDPQHNYTIVEIDKDLQCLVCLDSVNDSESYFLPCWHAFHTDCIVKWLEQNLFCPICRIPVFITGIDMLENYNKFYSIKFNDEDGMRNNISRDINSIAFMFMREYNLENITGYNDYERRDSLYRRILDEDEKEEPMPLPFSNPEADPLSFLNDSSVPLPPLAPRLALPHRQSTIVGPSVIPTMFNFRAPLIRPSEQIRATANELRPLMGPAMGPVMEDIIFDDSDEDDSSNEDD